MRAREFTKLKEFAPPGQNASVEQEKKDIMVLLGFKPSRDALAQIQSILGTAEPAQPKVNAAPVVKKQPIAQPQAKSTERKPTDTEPPNPETDELKEDLSLIDALVDRIKKLDPANPADASKIIKIEAILEEDVIEPAIMAIVKKKFNSFIDIISNDIKNAIISASNPVLDKIKFLTKCNKGLINLKKVLRDKANGNVYALINDPVFENIKKRLGQIEYGTGGNKLGRMEALLAFISAGVTKQGSGDLTLPGNMELEVKASSQDKKGNTSGAVLVALGKDKETGETAYGSNLQAGKLWLNAMQKVLPKVPSSLNSKSINTEINPYIAGDAKKINYTVNAIKEVYSFIFRHADSKMLAPLDSIKSKDGIDAGALIKAARQIEFDYYKKLIKHDAILFVNSHTGAYRYIETGQQLANELTSSKKGSNFYSTGILDMRGTYGNGLSKIFIS